MESAPGSFASALLEAPVGVALLATLEALHRDDRPVPWSVPPDVDPEAVERAVGAVGQLTVGALTALAVESAEEIAGPWRPDAPAQLADAYRGAGARVPIAEAVAARFASVLHADGERSAQEWWQSAASQAERTLFRRFDAVYGGGEFTWAGLWTVTAPPPEAHDALVGTWELFPGPVSRWRLPVDPDARIWEIHRPQDWARLVSTYPSHARASHMGWELPGPNQAADDVRGLLAVPGQRAVRTAAGLHLVPDWERVAADFDGVHLSWAGFLTSEGYITDIEGAVAMLRYWGSERTLWLADVFGDPQPLAGPALTGGVGGDVGVDVVTNQLRRERDRAALEVLLGRCTPPA